MAIITSFGRQLENKKTRYVTRINKPKEDSFFVYDDLILGKSGGVWKAYDRVCDHNGGTLYLDGNGRTATCPIHKWSLNLSDGEYENKCKKKPLNVIAKGDQLEIERFDSEFDNISTDDLTESSIDLHFNAHASVTVTIDNINITTDPWFLGSCFATGWWHSNPPSEEAIERLSNSRLIYISHNHPDHLHVQTLLEYVSKDTSIIVPNFESKSVEVILRKLGYKNLIVSDFLKEIEVISSSGVIKLVVVKSGDDRDDSSLLVVTKKHKIFFGVDTNMPNKWVLPEVDVLYTPFAGGASGFPSRIENFTLEKKRELIIKNKQSVLDNHVTKLINATKPKFVVPYAGYFTECERDFDVKEINVKNSPEELLDYVRNNFPSITPINPILSPHISITTNGIQIKSTDEIPSYFLDRAYVENDVNKFSGDNWAITDKFLMSLGQKFVESDFIDDLTIVIVPTDVAILAPISKSLLVDFSISNRSYKLMNLDSMDCMQIVNGINCLNSNNLEILKVRADSLYGAFTRGLPLEDLSIGFQIKMWRLPNVYNFKFWDYFTNLKLIQV